MLIGYARVSTADQKLDLQNDALTEAGCEQIFTDTAGGAGAERTGLEQALGLRPQGGHPRRLEARPPRPVAPPPDRDASPPSGSGGSASGASRRASTRRPAAASWSSTSSRPWPSSSGTSSASGPGPGSTRPGPAARGAAGGPSSTPRSGPRPSPCTATSRTPSTTSAGRSGSAGARSTATSPRRSRDDRPGPDGPSIQDVRRTRWERVAHLIRPAVAQAGIDDVTELVGHRVQRHPVRFPLGQLLAVQHPRACASCCHAANAAW